MKNENWRLSRRLGYEILDLLVRILSRSYGVRSQELSMASDGNIASRVRAAAQLVLQDLDPEARKRRQEFMSGNYIAY